MQHYFDIHFKYNILIFITNTERKIAQTKRSLTG